jgi:hypothetical protein
LLWSGHLHVMRHKTLHFVSPSYTHEKLEPPFFRDIVDVFEDRMMNWLVRPAKALLAVRHGEVAAVALTTNYFEGIEIYASGKDSKGQSRKFFARGFKKVFPGFTGPESLQSAVHSSFYELLRCGFAHDAMFRNGIYFSSVRKQPITVSWPRTNGIFDANGQLEAAIINPKSFVAGVEKHLTEYVRELRRLPDSETKEKFLAAVKLKWDLSGRERSIGMTEEEFYRAA